MKNILNERTVYIDRNNTVPIGKVKSESDVILNVKLIKDNKILILNNQKIKIVAKLPDNSIQEQITDISQSEDVITIKLHKSIIRSKGIVELELYADDNEGILITPTFLIEVLDSFLDDESIESTDYISTLELIITDFNKKSKETISNFLNLSNDKINEFNETSKNKIKEFVDDSTKQLDGQKKDYDSLKKIIIDENQAANLQSQINSNKDDIDVLKDERPMWENVEGISPLSSNNTFNSTVKSSIIKGSTLHNLADYKKATYIGGGKAEITYNNTTVKAKITTQGSVVLKIPLSYTLKNNSDYTVFYNIKTPSTVGFNSSFMNETNFAISLSEVKRNSFNKTKLRVGNDKAMYLGIGNHTGLQVGDIFEVSDIVLLEGDYTNKKMPFDSYFDGIMSCGEAEGNKIIVKSIGKNLLATSEYVFDKLNGKPVSYKTNVKLKVGVNYFFSGVAINVVQLEIINTDGTKEYKGINYPGGFKPTKEIKEVNIITRYPDWENNVVASVSNAMLEEGTLASKYEDYIEDKKEILLPCHHRRFNIYNGEKGEYTENDIELNLDRNSKWEYNKEYTECARFVVRGIANLKTTTDIISNLAVGGQTSLDSEAIQIASSIVHINIKKSKLITYGLIDGNTSTYLNAFKGYLDSVSGLTIITQLESPIVHNIDKMRLSTFPETTHFFQDNNIKGDMLFEVTVDRDARIEINDINIKYNKEDIEVCNKAIDINRIDIIKNEEYIQSNSKKITNLENDYFPKTGNLQFEGDFIPKNANQSLGSDSKKWSKLNLGQSDSSSNGFNDISNNFKFFHGRTIVNLTNGEGDALVAFKKAFEREIFCISTNVMAVDGDDSGLTKDTICNAGNRSDSDFWIRIKNTKGYGTAATVEWIAYGI